MLHATPAQDPHAALAQAMRTPSGWRPLNPARPVLASELAPIEGPSHAKRRADILACADVLQRGVGRSHGGGAIETNLARLIGFRTLNGGCGDQWPVPELIAGRLARLIVAVRTRPDFAPTPAAHREAVIWFRSHLGNPSAANAYRLPPGVIPPEMGDAFWRQPQV